MTNRKPAVQDLLDEANDAPVMHLDDTYHSSVIRGLMGPILPYFGDPSETDPERVAMAEAVTEIMINGPHEIYIDDGQGIQLHPELSFAHERDLISLARAILQYVGKRLVPEELSVEARTPEGHRVHIVQAPAARPGLSIAIRKFPKHRVRISDLVGRFHSFPPRVGEYFENAMQLRSNVLVSGGTGSGKTTLVNALSELIDPGERIIVIEDATEIRFDDDRHVLQFEAVKPDREGKGGITIRELLRASLRMRPDRVIIGECRAGEALDMIQAMNTGHAGSMSTIHANSPEDCLARLETLCLMADVNIPLIALQRQAASAIDTIVQVSRWHGFKRVTGISEVRGFDLGSGSYDIRPMFRLEPDASGPRGFLLKWTGETPRFGEGDHGQGVELAGKWREEDGAGQ
jgi:pilus assembly protein CpaF